MNKSTIIKIILLAIALTVCAVLIYTNAKGFAIFFGGFIVGCLCLMVLREFLWNVRVASIDSMGHNMMDELESEIESIKTSTDG
jgi:predicted lysophospholipase L1 biosynthesis ABC-type transport system permease subunit